MGMAARVPGTIANMGLRFGHSKVLQVQIYQTFGSNAQIAGINGCQTVGDQSILWDPT